jgi:hypothetical protein
MRIPVQWQAFKLAGDAFGPSRGEDTRWVPTIHRAAPAGTYQQARRRATGFRVMPHSTVGATSSVIR